MPEWKRTRPGVEHMTVAVMGCVVNGPGESKAANIGISLPGTGEVAELSCVHRRPACHHPQGDVRRAGRAISEARRRLRREEVSKSRSRARVEGRPVSPRSACLPVRRQRRR